MFDVEFMTSIKSIKVKVTEKNSIVQRRCVVVLEREFDDMMAAGLGGEARSALEALRDGGMTSCVLPIEGINARGRFVTTADSVEVGELVGVKATGKASADDEFPPSIALELDMPWDEAAWVFLGRHSGGFAHLTLSQRQGSLPLVVDFGKGRA